MRVKSLDEAAKLIHAANYRFDVVRSYVERGRGWAFSVESDISNFGHPLMEVQIIENVTKGAK